MMNKTIEKGFSLIELALVLFIIGLLVAGLIGPMATQLEQRERQQTAEVMEEVEEALYGFAIANGRLPCPDCTDTTGGCAAATANDGQEDLTGAIPNRTCATLIGNMPWVDLTISQFDIWGRTYGYRVTGTFADEPDGTGVAACSTTSGISFQLCSTADITILDRGSGCPVTAPGGMTVANNVPAIVFSQGKKIVTEQPLSCYEEENTDADATFVSTDYSRHEGADPADSTLNFYYDDMVIWLSPHILMNRMVTAGRLP